MGHGGLGVISLLVAFAAIVGCIYFWPLISFMASNITVGTAAEGTPLTSILGMFGVYAAVIASLGVIWYISNRT